MDGRGALAAAAEGNKMRNERVVVIPAYEREMEIGTLSVLLKRLGDVVVLDNGSDDDTAKVARSLGAVVIRMRERRDWRSLLRSTQDYVRERDYREVIIYDPIDRAEVEGITKAVNGFQGGMVRFHVPGNVEDPEPFYFGTWLMDRESLLKMRLSGLRLSPQREIMHYEKKLSIPFKEVTVERATYSKAFKKKKSGRFSLRGIFRRSFIRNHPLTFWGSLGVFTLFIGLFMGTITINYFYTHHRLHYYYAAATFLLVFLSGIFLFTGLILNAFSTLKERVDELLKGV